MNVKNKLGLSAVVATLMLILLTLVLVGILWAVIGGIFSDNVDDSKNCFGNFDKVTINERYTCYDPSVSPKEFKFSINVDDIEADAIIVGISDNSGQKISFKLNKSGSYPYLKPLNGNYGDNVSVPGENSGLTYIFNVDSKLSGNRPDLIEIIPVIEGSQCEVSSRVSEIVYCSAL